MKAKKKKKTRGKFIVALLILGIIVGIVIFIVTRPRLLVVTVTDRIDDYDYYIESNSTKIQEKYFGELKKHFEEKNNIEEDYVKIISKLFITEYYTLNNKVTNKDIGGVQYVHSELKNKFINDAANSMYKYIENNLYGKRKQKLPEVKTVTIKDVSNIRYDSKGYKDNDGYIVKAKVSYVKDYDYPKEVKLVLIHENNKIVVVEVE